MARYFCVHIGARGDAIRASGRARYLARSNPKNFLTFLKKAEENGDKSVIPQISGV